MEQRVSLITIGITDLERSRDFYEKGLGWVAGFANEHVVFYQLNGMILALWNKDALAEDAGLPAGSTGVGGIALAYNVKDRGEVDKMLAEAERAGAKILKPGSEAFWGGYTGYFADPDGHPWEVAWNPGWVLYEDGRVSLKNI